MTLGVQRPGLSAQKEAVTCASHTALLHDELLGAGWRWSHLRVGVEAQALAEARTARRWEGAPVVHDVVQEAAGPR